MDLLTNTFRQFVYTKDGKNTGIVVNKTHGLVQGLNSRIIGIQAPEGTRIYFNMTQPPESSSHDGIQIGYTHIYQLELEAEDESARIHSILFSLPNDDSAIVIDVLDSGRTASSTKGV